jgi:hypothetical protein
MTAPVESEATTDGAERRVAVDPTLVDYMLALTPEERLRQNDRMLRTIQELRDGFAAARSDDSPVAPGSERG